jgi:hypothetical protein
MTGVAVRSLMAAGQSELGIPIVVEPNLCPFLFGVTGLAFLAIAAPMNIIQAMAGGALTWRILEAVVDMTELAIGISVLAPEGKTLNGVMIKL